jgi:RNA recognition motif-containing protein
MRQAGEVVHAEVLRSSDGRSKGCGLVRYSNAAEAKTAIETLTDTDLAGRPIIVREDREENKYKSGASVFVGNLPWTTSWQNLKDFLRDYGSILHVEIMTDPTGRSKGAAIVRFAEPADAQKAIDELNGTDFEGRPLILRPDRNA